MLTRMKTLFSILLLSTGAFAQTSEIGFSDEGVGGVAGNGTSSANIAQYEYILSAAYSYRAECLDITPPYDLWVGERACEEIQNRLLGIAPGPLTISHATLFQNCCAK